MKIIIILTIIIVMVILIIKLPLKMKAGLHINYINMEVYYIVNFLLINLICGKFCIVDEKLRIENKSNYLIKGSKETNSGKYEIIEYLKRINVVNINFFKTYGNNCDAMNTSIIIALDGLIYYLICKYLKIKNKNINYYNYLNPQYNSVSNMTSVYCVIKISVLDVIISKIKAKLNRRKLRRENG